MTNVLFVSLEHFFIKFLVLYASKIIRTHIFFQFTNVLHTCLIVLLLFVCLACLLKIVRFCSQSY